MQGFRSQNRMQQGIDKIPASFSETFFRQFHGHIGTGFRCNAALENTGGDRAGKQDPHLLFDSFPGECPDQSIHKSLMPEIFKKKRGDRTAVRKILFPQLFQTLIQSDKLFFPFQQNGTTLSQNFFRG